MSRIYENSTGEKDAATAARVLSESHRVEVTEAELRKYGPNILDVIRIRVKLSLRQRELELLGLE